MVPTNRVDLGEHMLGMRKRLHLGHSDKHVQTHRNDMPNALHERSPLPALLLRLSKPPHVHGQLPNKHDVHERMHGGPRVNPARTGSRQADWLWRAVDSLLY